MEHDAQSSRLYKENWDDAVQAGKADAAEIETLRAQLAHWKTFAIHAEGEHAAWKKTAAELDEELRALKAATVDGRTYTQADLLEAVKTERHACSICVWMVLRDALEPDADDKGLEGWMREAEQRVKNRLAHHRTEAHSVRLTRCPTGKCEDPVRDCYGSGCLSDEPQSDVAAAYGGLTQTPQG